MHQEKDILDILARSLMGHITDEEQRQLDTWMEDPHHKALMDDFLKRRDMCSIYSLSRSHSRMGSPFVQNELGTGNGEGDMKEEEDSKTMPTQVMVGNEMTGDDVSTSGSGEGFDEADETEGKHRSIMLWLKVAGIAAVAIFAFMLGNQWWEDYTKVVMPQIDEATMMARRTSIESGRSDAQVTIRHKDCSAPAAKASVIDDGGLTNLYSSLGESLSSGMPDDMYADIITHHDKEFWMTLPDGTRVHLNYNSSLTYPLSFTGSSREVVLDGEAYFFVAKDKRRPFIVHTSYGDVKEYGTEFDVNTRYDSNDSPGAYGIRGKGLAVVLVEGSISIIPRSNDEYMLKPGDLAVVTHDAEMPQIKPVDTAPFTSWNTGTFAFSDCPLDRLLDVVGRWHGKSVRFADNSLRKIHFNGELDRYESLENIISALEKSTSTRMKITSDAITVGQ